ncbi:MAG TPA: oligosaccharide flippase family protein [Bacteroidales bacterium]|nr:oligosaccharide flippase family protein [Bacteroidales bacterium]HOK99180.1 oligosaccharide flippase family protein [Bacteroidales bacterium]HPO65047.1 oligosaccharide flippase family protein [Bacteroidales bacterium]
MSASVRTLGRQTVIYGLSTIVPRFLNFLLVPLYTYFFSPAEYGIVADLYSWAVLLNIIVTYGMETAVFRYAKMEGNNAFASAFYSVLFTSLIFLFIVIYLSGTIANLLGYPGYGRYIIYFGFILALDAVSAILFVKLRLDEKALKFSVLKISNVVVNVFLNVLFIVLLPKFLVSFGIKFNRTVEYIFISNLLASLVTFLFLVIYIPSFRFFNFRVLRTMIVYGIPLMLSGIVGAINDVIDRQFIKYLSPPGVDAMSQLGIYFANLKLAVFLVLFVQAFRYAAEPFFFRYAEDPGSKESFARVTLFYVFVSLTVFLFTYANLPLFKYFIGSQYWSGLSIVPVVLLANVFAGLYLNFSMWYKLVDKTFLGFLIILAGSLFTVIFDYFFVPKYGYEAAAVVRLFSYIFITVLCYLLGQRYYSIPYRIFTMLKYFIIALLVFYFQYEVLNNLTFMLVILINNVLLMIFVLYFIYAENLFKPIRELLWSIRSKLKL